MYAPIRSITSSEVRRVDEVNPRRGVTERLPSRFAQGTESVRITIGANARQLASRKDDGRFEDALDARAPELAVDSQPPAQESEPAYLPSPREGMRRTTLATNDGPGAGASSEFANRALQSLTTAEAATGAPSPDSDDVFEQVWSGEESSKVPFEVLQRAVTQATARGGAPVSNSRTKAIEPLFAAPENGGQPYGRAVPFESEGQQATPELPLVRAEDSEKAAQSRLSEADVEDVISDLSWSLPGPESARVASEVRR